MSGPLIQFTDADLGYGRKVVLRGITFSIWAGDYLGVVGPNGAGKTTVLRTILGTLKPLKGSVAVGGGGMPAVRFGYVPQRDSIDSVLPYTVLDVVMMGRTRQLGLLHRAGQEDREIVRESLVDVGIEDLRDRMFRDLSGGQKQRALIARALAARPEVLLLDEPTNGMDLSSRLAILDLIRRLHAEGGLTVIMVSHLLDDVANHVKRIAIVEPNFFQVGEIREVLTGKNLSALYQMPVEVDQLRGKIVILPGGRRDNI